MERREVAIVEYRVDAGGSEEKIAALNAAMEKATTAQEKQAAAAMAASNRTERAWENMQAKIDPVYRAQIQMQREMERMARVGAEAQERLGVSHQDVARAMQATEALHRKRIEDIRRQTEVTKELTDAQKLQQDLQDQLLRSVSGIAVGAGAYFSVSAVRDNLGAALNRIEAVNRAARQLDQALRNTGNTANTSSREVIAFATALEDRTGRAMQEVLDVSTNLATYGFSNEVFFRALTLADDMSRAWGGDLKQSLEGLGRALDDPIRGFAMLRQRGISLTEDQDRMVKSFMAVNDIASAQRVVFEALEEQVRSVAEAGFEDLTRAQSRSQREQDRFWESLVRSSRLMEVQAGGLGVMAGAFGFMADHADIAAAAIAAVSAAITVSLIPAATKGAVALWGLMAALIPSSAGIAALAVGALAGGLVYMATRTSEVDRLTGELTQSVRALQDAYRGAGDEVDRIAEGTKNIAMVQFRDTYERAAQAVAHATEDFRERLEIFANAGGPLSHIVQPGGALYEIREQLDAGAISATAFVDKVAEMALIDDALLPFSRMITEASAELIDLEGEVANADRALRDLAGSADQASTSIRGAGISAAAAARDFDIATGRAIGFAGALRELQMQIPATARAIQAQEQLERNERLYQQMAAQAGLGTGQVDIEGLAKLRQAVEDARLEVSGLNNVTRQLDDAQRRTYIDSLPAREAALERVRDQHAQIAAQIRDAIGATDAERMEALTQNAATLEQALANVNAQFDQTTSRGGGGGRGSGRGDRGDAFDRAMKAANDNIEAMTREAETYGMTEAAAARYTLQLDLLAAAKETNRAITPDLISEINKAGDAFEKAYEQSLKLAQSQRDIEQVQRGFENMSSSMVKAFAKGEDLLDAFAKGISRIGDMLIDMAMRNLWANAFGGGAGFGGGGGGLLGGMIIPGILHRGGTAGVDGYGHGRAYPAALWATAPRYHNGSMGVGLRPNEVPAILERGEKIIPANVNVTAANGNAPIIQIIDQRGNAPAIEQRETLGPNGQRMVQLIVRDELERYSERELPSRVKEIGARPYKRGVR